MEVKNSISRAYCCLQKRHRNFEKRKKVSVKVLPKGIHLNSVFSEPVYISILFSNSNASDRDFLIAKTPTSASQEHHSVSTHPLMSFLIPVFVGCLAVYLAWRLIPRSNVEIKDKYVLITGCDSGFGRKTAIRLDEMGVRVIATCLTKEGEQNLKSVTSDRLKTFQMDVTNSQNIRDVFDEVERRIPDETGKQTLVLSVVKLSSVYFIWCHWIWPMFQATVQSDLNCLLQFICIPLSVASLLYCQQEKVENSFHLRDPRS